jgi:putative inorganic carbon (HCO3(-)) transporter
MHKQKKVSGTIASDKLKPEGLFTTAYLTNWPLLIFIFFLPLVNLQHKFFPPLPGGVNFMNVMFILCLIWAFRIKGETNKDASVSKWIIWFLCYGFVSYLIMLMTLSFPTPNSLNSFKDFAFILLLVFIVQKSIKDWGGFRRIILATLLSLPYTYRLVWSQYLTVSKWHYSNTMRVSGPFSDLGANELGAYCVSASLFAICLLVTKNSKKSWKWGLYIFVFCATMSIMFSYSRGSYLAFFVGVFFIFMHKQKRLKTLMIVLLISLMASPFIPVSVQERFSTISSSEEERDDSAQSRFVFWAIAFEKYKSSPIVGYGYKSWGSPEINPTHMDTHNYFIKTLVEKGAIGVIILIGLLYSIYRQARKTHLISKDNPWASAVSLGVISATIALFFGNMFGDRFSHTTVVAIYWIYVGLMLKIPLLLPKER